MPPLPNAFSKNYSDNSMDRRNPTFHTTLTNNNSLRFSIQQDASPSGASSDVETGGPASFPRRKPILPPRTMAAKSSSFAMRISAVAMEPSESTYHDEDDTKEYDEDEDEELPPQDEVEEEDDSIMKESSHRGSVIGRVMNNKNQEVDEDGGFFDNMSRCEWITVALVSLCIAVAVIAASLVLVGNNNKNHDDSSGNSNAIIDANTNQASTTTTTTTMLKPVEQFDQIRSAVMRNPILHEYAEQMPILFKNLPLKARYDHTQPAAVRAMAWVVHEDNQDNAVEEIIARFALATIYFETKGDEWVTSQKWLTNFKICGDEDGPGNWHGVTCSYGQNKMRISELKFSNNNIVGPIPKAFALFDSLQALWLDRNNISGFLDPELFHSMPKLQSLYLQHNRLTGPIPNNFLKDGNNLRTFFLQGNHFTGNFPVEYCPVCEDCDSPLLEFGLDCKANPCDLGCCDPLENCHDN